MYVQKKRAPRRRRPGGHVTPPTPAVSATVAHVAPPHPDGARARCAPSPEGVNAPGRASPAGTRPSLPSADKPSWGHPEAQSPCVVAPPCRPLTWRHPEYASRAPGRAAGASGQAPRSKQEAEWTLRSTGLLCEGAVTVAFRFCPSRTSRNTIV